MHGTLAFIRVVAVVNSGRMRATGGEGDEACAGALRLAFLASSVGGVGAVAIERACGQRSCA